MNIIDIIKQDNEELLEQYMNNITSHILLNEDDVLWLIKNGWTRILESKLVTIDYKSKILIWNECKIHLFKNHDYISMIKDRHDILEYINGKVPSVEVIIECYKNGRNGIAHRILDMCKIDLTIEDEGLVEYGIDMIKSGTANVDFVNMSVYGIRLILENNLMNYVTNTNLQLTSNELDSLMIGCEDHIMKVLPILQLDHDLLEYICDEYSQYLTNMDNYVIEECPSNIYPFLSYKCLVRLYEDGHNILDYIALRRDRLNNMIYFLRDERMYLLLDRIRHKGSTIRIYNPSIHIALLLDDLVKNCKYNVSVGKLIARADNIILYLQYMEEVKVENIDYDVDSDIIEYYSLLFPLGFERFRKLYPDKYPSTNKVPTRYNYPSDVTFICTNDEENV